MDETMRNTRADGIKKWIYVTGAPRSGTTFVGKVLSRPLCVDYIHEPFNPACGMEGAYRRYRYLRTTPDTPEMQHYASLMPCLLSYDFRLGSNPAATDGRLRAWGKRLSGGRGALNLFLARHNPFHRVAVIKDPTAPFVAQYLQEKWGVVPVVIVRHPVSHAAALLRLQWHPSLHWMAEQDAFREDFFGEDPSFLDQHLDDIVVAAAFHWRAVYKVLLEQAASFGFVVVTLEALSAEPEAEFQALYRTLGLPWSLGVAQYVRKLTMNAGAGEVRNGKVQDFRRDSAAIFALRRSQLSETDRQVVFDITQDVACRLYSTASFGLAGEALDDSPLS